MRLSLAILCLLCAAAFAADEEPSRAEVERQTKRIEDMRQQMAGQLLEKNEKAAVLADRYSRTNFWTGNSKRAKANRKWRAAIEKQAKKAADDAARTEREYQGLKQKHEQGQAKIKQMEQAEAKAEADKAQARTQAEMTALTETAAKNHAWRKIAEQEDKVVVAAQQGTERTYRQLIDDTETLLVKMEYLKRADKIRADEEDARAREVGTLLPK